MPTSCSVGSLRVDQSVPASEEDIDKDWDEKYWVLKGGAWRPTKCQAISKVCYELARYLINK